MRFLILVPGILLMVTVHPAAGQQKMPTQLRQLETEMLARISARAIANVGLRLETPRYAKAENGTGRSSAS